MPGECSQVYVSNAAKIVCVNPIRGLVSVYVNEQWEPVKFIKGLFFQRIAISTNDRLVALELGALSGGTWCKEEAASSNSKWHELKGL